MCYPPPHPINPFLDHGQGEAAVEMISRASSVLVGPRSSLRMLVVTAPPPQTPRPDFSRRLCDCARKRYLHKPKRQIWAHLKGANKPDYVPMEFLGLSLEERECWCTITTTAAVELPAINNPSRVRQHRNLCTTVAHHLAAFIITN